MNVDKTNFESMLAIAEMAEQWHHNRRQLEFRIMISYTTLLALAVYQVIKPRDPSESLAISWEISLIACLGLVIIWVIYCRWQYIFHIASNNDVRRRDFYLKKAEAILHHMSQYSASHFVPDPRKAVIINLAAENNCEMSEVELFNEPEPDIYIRSEEIGTPPSKWYKNRHLLTPLVFPTILTISLITALFAKADVIKNIKIW